MHIFVSGPDFGSNHFKVLKLMCTTKHGQTHWEQFNTCDPTEVTEADVVRRPNYGFDVSVFYRSQEKFWYKEKKRKQNKKHHFPFQRYKKI